MKGPQVSILELRVTEVYEKNLHKVRNQMEEVRPLCSQAGATTLPPFRAINHSILMRPRSTTLSRGATAIMGRKEKYSPEVWSLGDDHGT